MNICTHLLVFLAVNVALAEHTALNLHHQLTVLVLNS